MAECTFAPKTTPVPAYLAQQMSDACAAAMVQERLAEILAMRGATDEEGEAMHVQGEGAGCGGGGAGGGGFEGAGELAARMVAGAWEPAAAQAGNGGGGGGGSYCASTARQAAARGQGDARDSMARELAQLQARWAAQQAARAAGQAAGGSGV